MAKKKVGEGELDPKYLKGLKFKTSNPEKVKGEGGVEKTKYIPETRALTVDDVLDWVDNSDSVTIVTADGQKYNVKKEK
jgi:hypothetical protein